MKRYLQAILNILTGIYMLLIIVALPFYFEEGYRHIGTDKSYFFRTCTKYAAAILLPVLVAYLICMAAEWFRRITAEQTGILAGLKKSATAWKNKWSVTDTFALGYAVSTGLSYLFSDYKATALWGEPGWYMGTIPQLMFVGVYFAVSRLWKKRDWIVYLFLPVSAVVFVLGYLNRFDIWPIPMENSGMPSFISTIGNINWYCGYLVSVFFLGVGLFWLDRGEKKWKTFLLALYCFVGFGTMVTQGSDSGIFALGVVLFFLFVMSARKVSEDAILLRRFWQLLLIFSAACGVTRGIRALFPEQINFTSWVMDLFTDSPFFLLPAIAGIAVLWLIRLQERHKGMEEKIRTVFRIAANTLCVIAAVAAIMIICGITVNTIHPGASEVFWDNRLLVFDENWGSGRGATWRAGWQCFSDQNALHRLVGVGPDCMAEYIYSGTDQKLLEDVRQIFAIIRLTNAHCELLTILVCNGLLGVVCFMGMMGSAGVRFLGRLRGKIAETALTDAARKRSETIICSCGLCVLAYLGNNIWSFQQSMCMATIFLMLGLGENIMKENTV